MRHLRALVLVLCAALAAVATLRRALPAKERPITDAWPSTTLAPALATASPPAPASSPPSASLASDVRAALARIFGKALSVENGVFAVGDLNGDGAPDVAIAVRPSPESLADLSADLANWILEEPEEAPSAAKGRPRAESRPEPVRLQPGDVLVAVIHGVGPTGWRNPEARQTYLLRRATDPGTPLRVAPGRGPTPDVLATTLEGRPVWIYWTGARYALRSSPVDR